MPTCATRPNWSRTGACRVCSVEVAQTAEGPRRVVASCHTPITPGVHIFTQSQKVQKLRRNILELVLSDHPPECLTCEINGNCELQTVAAKVGSAANSLHGRQEHLESQEGSCRRSRPHMTSDLAKCINCARCVRACDEIQGQFVSRMNGRGFDSRIIRASTRPSTIRPVFRAAPRAACPTSALSVMCFNPRQHQADEENATICTVLRRGLQPRSCDEGERDSVHSGPGRMPRSTTRIHASRGVTHSSSTITVIACANR